MNTKRADTNYLIGYGTLLYNASLASSIGKSAVTKKIYIPVIVDGYIRTFNLRARHYSPSHMFESGGEERAAMNVEPSTNHSFNGIAFQITDRELELLDKREIYYERHVVPIRTFESGKIIAKGNIYVGLEPWIIRDPQKLMPLWRDVIWGRTGAYQIGERFGQYFDKTTYISDNKVLVVDKYRKFLENINDNPLC